MFKGLRDGLGVMLMFCIVMRIGAWLVALLIPMLLLLFVMVSLIYFMLFGRRQ